jgi:hypothetical protein
MHKNASWVNVPWALAPAYQEAADGCDGGLRKWGGWSGRCVAGLVFGD